MKMLAGLAALLALTFAGSAASHTSAGFTCNGQIVKIFDNRNGSPVVNGAKPPTFTTNGAYCITSIGTYHWNGGKGAAPGSLSLTHLSGPSGFATVGPFPAQGSAGQNGAPNVNWQANVSTSPSPAVIDGTYACGDSSPATWSANTAGGPGFCIVYGVPAQGGPTPAPTTTAAKAPSVKASAKEVVEPDGRIELIVKDLGTTPIMTVWFRPHNWIIEKLGAVQQQGICTLKADEMDCGRHFTIDPGGTFNFTIKTYVGVNDGGYIWVSGTANAPEQGTAVPVSGPKGSPPPTPPPHTPATRAKDALNKIDDAIPLEETAVADFKAGTPQKAYRVLNKSEDLLIEAYTEIRGIEQLDDAYDLLDRARIIDDDGKPARMEEALKDKTLALAEIRTFLAKKR